MSSKVHLVSGSTSGIGKAFADLAVSRGDSVIPILRPVTAQALGDPDGAVVCDLADPESVVEAFGNFDRPIDSFVNCAGILPGRQLLDTDARQAAEIFNVNTISPALIIKHVIPHLRPGGTVLLTGSISGFKGSYDDLYAASKGAIHSLVKSLAPKLAPDRRIVGVAPGTIRGTRMTNELVPGRFEHNLAQIPLGRAGEPADMAEIMYFLCSDACKFITGAILDMNGGQYLR